MSKEPFREVATIDFSKYRTPELFERVQDIVDIRGVFRNVFWQAMLVTLVVLAGVTILFWGRVSLFWLAPIDAYGLIAGCAVGVIYGIAETIRRSLGNMLQIIDILLGTTRQIAADSLALGSGQTRLPTARELIEGTYVHVILPIVEQVVAGQLWILGGPFLFLYRMTLGRMVRATINTLPTSSLTAVPEKELENHVATLKTGIDEVAAREHRIVEVLDWARGHIVSIGGWLRFLVMLPCYAISLGLSVTILLPILVTWFMTGGK